MKQIFLTTIVLLFSLHSCVFDYVDGIQIVNNSNQGQIICYSCFDSIGSIIDSLTMTPYFKQFDNFKPEIINKDAFINKNSSQGYRISGRKETIVRFCPDKHVRFFFISDSVFMNNPWDTIVKYQMYNRKLVFSEKDLKENDWTVVYE